MSVCTDVVNAVKAEKGIHVVMGMSECNGMM
jgi:hypothetical protein